MNSLVERADTGIANRYARNSGRYIGMEAAVRGLCTLTAAADSMAAVLDEYEDDELRALRNVIDLANGEARKLAGAYR